MPIARAESHKTQDGWLALRRGGMSVIQIAREAGVPPRTVHDGIHAARQREGSSPTLDPSRLRVPRLTLIFGSSCKALAALTCEDVHRGPLKHGTSCCCGVCHRSGKDHYRALYCDPARMPKPERKQKPAKSKLLTRRERRAIMRAG